MLDCFRLSEGKAKDMQEHAEGPRSKPPVICHHCGAVNPPGSTECSKCETALAGPGAEAEKTREK